MNFKDFGWWLLGYVLLVLCVDVLLGVCCFLKVKKEHPEYDNEKCLDTVELLSLQALLNSPTLFLINVPLSILLLLLRGDM